MVDPHIIGQVPKLLYLALQIFSSNSIYIHPPHPMGKRISRALIMVNHSSLEDHYVICTEGNIVIWDSITIKIYVCM